MSSKVKLAVLASFILTATLACNAPADSDAPPERDAPVATTTEAPAKEEPDPSGADEPASGTVPNVVGMNHQAAQNAMQEAGFYHLSEEDATGQGRVLIMDRNWVVVSQSPKGGAKVSEDTKIVLRSKKLDDE